MPRIHKIRQIPPPGAVGGHLSTGDVARICAVQADTVLKWIKRGKLPATRTVGGHHRVNYLDLVRFLGAEAADSEQGAPCNANSRPLRCWEYFSKNGHVPEPCKECVVYRIRAAWCFEVLGIADQLQHAEQFCSTSCEDCAYYQLVKGLAIRLLVVSSDTELERQLATGNSGNIIACFASNGYHAATLVQSFHPAWILLDEELGHENWRDLAHCLAQDPRIPGVRTVLATARTGVGFTRLEQEARELDVTGVLSKPVTPEAIWELIHQVPVEQFQPGQ